MMTERECFLATTSHRRPDRVLYHFDMTPDLEQRMIQHIGTDQWRTHFGLFAPVEVAPERPADLPRPDYTRYWEGETLPPGTTFDSHGVAMAPSGFYHFWGYISPLRKAESLAEIENYPLDDIAQWDFSGMADKVRRARAEGRVTNLWVGHMYETAWQIRGYEEFLMDVVERPAWAECLLERLAQQNRVKALAAARAGVDRITTGDDVANQQAMMFAPDTWRRIFHSRWAATWREVKEINAGTRIWYHSDGNVLDIVGDLVDAGMDILNPLQPECLDIDEVHKRWGGRLSFDGAIGTQSTMPFGTPDEVRARVKEVIEKYGREGGLMISPTHILEPDVPLANIEALVEACREYGALA